MTYVRWECEIRLTCGCTINHVPADTWEDVRATYDQGYECEEHGIQDIARMSRRSR